MNLISILCLSLVVFISAVQAQVNFIIAGNEYFTDVTTKITRQAAVELCEGKNAELAKIPDLALYYQILINLVDSGPNTYWIDGIYSAENPNEFKLDDKCTSGSLNLVGVPYLKAATNLCLAIERGENAISSQIRSLTCGQTHHVLCSKPELIGCNPEPEPTTPGEGEDTTGPPEGTTGPPEGTTEKRTEPNRFHYIPS